MVKGTHFSQIYAGKANDVIPVQKYCSNKTGLTVATAEVEGPLVNGFLCVGASRSGLVQDARAYHL